MSTKDKFKLLKMILKETDNSWHIEDVAYAYKIMYKTLNK